MKMRCLKARIRNIMRDIRTKIAFFSTGSVGLLSYMYYMVNDINNHDQIQHIPGGIGPASASGRASAFGRWLFYIGGEITEKIIGAYNIPFLFGSMAIFMLGLVSLILIRIFEIKNHTMCFVLSAVTVSFPTIATQMLYTFAIHYYMFAIFLGISGVYFLKYFCEEPDRMSSNKKSFLWKGVGIIVAALLFACSMGIYQAYLPFVAAIILLRLIQMCLMQHTKWKNILEYSVCGLLSLALSYLFYRIILKICLLVFPIELTSDKGVDRMGQIDFERLPALVYRTYKSYLLLFLEPYCEINATTLIKLCILIINVFCLLSLIFLWKKKDILKVVELCAFLALLPLASNFSVIMAPEIAIYNSVLMGVISIFYLPIVIYEKIDYKSVNIKIFSQTVVFVAIMLVVLSYIWIANMNYRALYYANRKMENYYTVMWTRITQSEGYNENMKVTFVGNQINDASFYENWYLSSVHLYYGNLGFPSELNIYSRKNFFANYLGHTYVEITEEERQKYSDMIMSMDTYPNDNSIQVIDGLVLVRLE